MSGEQSSLSQYSGMWAKMSTMLSRQIFSSLLLVPYVFWLNILLFSKKSNLTLKKK